jgi:hypothetical protein
MKVLALSFLRYTKTADLLACVQLLHIVHVLISLSLNMHSVSLTSSKLSAILELTNTRKKSARWRVGRLIFAINGGAADQAIYIFPIFLFQICATHCFAWHTRAIPYRRALKDLDCRKVSFRFGSPRTEKPGVAFPRWDFHACLA